MANELVDFEITGVSLVSHCPYCGSDKWNEPGVKPNGDRCDHPTKLRTLKGGAADGK